MRVALGRVASWCRGWLVRRWLRRRAPTARARSDAPVELRASALRGGRVALVALRNRVGAVPGGCDAVGRDDAVGGRRWRCVGAGADGVGARLLARTELPARVTPADFGLRCVVVQVAGVRGCRYYGAADDLSGLLRDDADPP